MANESPLIIVILAGLILGVFIGLITAKFIVLIQKILIKRKSLKAFYAQKQNFTIGNKVFPITDYDIGEKGFNLKEEIEKQRGDKQARQSQKEKGGLFSWFKKKEPIVIEKEENINKKKNRVHKRKIKR